MRKTVFHEMQPHDYSKKSSCLCQRRHRGRQGAHCRQNTVRHYRVSGTEVVLSRKLQTAQLWKYCTYPCQLLIFSRKHKMQQACI